MSSTFAPASLARIIAASIVCVLATAHAQWRSGSALEAVSTGLVLSQVYGGGGNSGAVWRNDFIEVFNLGDTEINVNGWSVQYNSAAGSGTWQFTTLAGTIPPGGYYLVQEAQGMGGTMDLPTPDAIGTIPMSATAGKVALVSTSMPLVGANPSRPDIIDRVGYGAASSFEGTGPAPELANTTAAIRALRGCIDSDDNAADFASGVPRPRNSEAPLNTCDAIPITINEIQGDSTSSAYADALVQTTGIVTARKGNGFFIQTPDEEVDKDPNTSEGVFIFTQRAPSAAARVGNLVSVSGFVQEFVPPSDQYSPPLTELADLPLVSLISEGNDLPQPATLTADDTDPDGPIEQLERFEGMRVYVESLTVTAPTRGFITETTATATSSGVFYGVITGIARPFREPGIERPEPIPMPPCCIPSFDGNPERLGVDSRSQPGSVILNVATGAVAKDLIGPLDYAGRTYTIVTDPPGRSPGRGTARSSVAAPSAGPEAWSVASFNLQRFFNDLNDGPGPRLTEAAFANRLNKASLAIRTRLASPDIIGVQEAENINTLGRLAAKINSDAIETGEPDPAYEAFLTEGHDVGGIDVGFLVKTSRVTVLEDPFPEGWDERFEDGTYLHDRPPLVLRAIVQSAAGDEFPVTVYVNHLRSRRDLTDPGGDRARRKRRAQAESLAMLIQARQKADPTERIISVGDYNSYQFNDGYADVIGTILGAPTPEEEVELASPDLVEPNLLNLTESVPAESRYSYVFDGNAEVLDHVLITENIVSFVRRVDFVHINADFPEIMRNDADAPERLSDHDPVVAYFSVVRSRPGEAVTRITPP